MLIANEAPSGLFSNLIGPDTWAMARQFCAQEIALCVVGVEPDVAACYDFYCALSGLTGKSTKYMRNFIACF